MISARLLILAQDDSVGALIQTANPPTNPSSVAFVEPDREEELMIKAALEERLTIEDEDDPESRKTLEPCETWVEFMNDEGVRWI